MSREDVDVATKIVGYGAYKRRLTGPGRAVQHDAEMPGDAMVNAPIFGSQELVDALKQQLLLGCRQDD